MSYAKLHTRIESGDEFYPLLLQEVPDPLAKRIFDPDISSESTAVAMYVPSVVNSGVLERYGLKIKVTEGLRNQANGLLGPDAGADFGLYEAVVFLKAIHPFRRVLCLIGGIGSGKTTFLRHLTNTLEKRPHCKAGKDCNENRLIVSVDFNTKSYRYVRDEGKAQEKLTRELRTKMRAALVNSRLVPRNEEVTAFWDLEIEATRSEHYVSQAFSEIIERLDEQGLRQDSNALEARKAIRADIVNSPDSDISIDYLARLWRYVVTHKYSGGGGCAAILLDNIDMASPMVQRALLDIVAANASASGTVWILLMRPETFWPDAMAARIVDRIPHHGPEPLTVIRDRLQRFLRQPLAYYTEEELLSREEFGKIEESLRRVNAMLGTTEGKPISAFVRQACGNNIRAALMIAQTLPRLRFSPLGRSTPSAHDIVRALIRMGGTRFVRAPGSPIENMFHVAGGRAGRFTVKSRILQYLAANEEEQNAELADVQLMGKGFGYGTTLIRKAVNELLYKNRQLIRSDGFDQYRDDDEFNSSATQIITLTHAGLGYITELIYMIDYIQEVMLDCVVDTTVFGPRNPARYAEQKFDLLLRFLRIVAEEDRSEVDTYLAKRGRDSYVDVFGGYLLTWEIYSSVKPAIENIVLSIAKSNPQHSQRYDRLRAQLESLGNLLSAWNAELLGIDPRN